MKSTTQKKVRRVKYSHIDIPIPEGCEVKSVEQRGDFVRVNLEGESEWTITKMDFSLPSRSIRSKKTK